MDIDATRALIPVSFARPQVPAVGPKGANRQQDKFASAIYSQMTGDNECRLVGGICGGLLMKGKNVDIYV
ncbi:hypothetical protein PITCH_A240023 [uncultured Desulfobacterium sp.]|uniref:Uncharacterized protein n=1 Tax=uncultured Desulfobacterium sp. TaxID=201089 RepID=A0A445MYW5_9BACT|nr:hypothetical protein PITCH_A240023 [uncultured Desulfobacterium sp.]